MTIIKILLHENPLLMRQICYKGPRRRKCITIPTGSGCPKRVGKRGEDKWEKISYERRGRDR